MIFEASMGLLIVTCVVFWVIIEIQCNHIQKQCRELREEPRKFHGE